MATTVLTGARVVVPETTLDPGWVEVDGGTIVAAGAGRRHGARCLDLGGGWLVPGFVDLHVHGGGGASFQSGDRDEVATAAALHRRHGTTTLLASLVSAPLDELVTATAALAGAVADGTVAGVHLEGPYLSERRRGAHDAGCLRAPDPAELARLLGAGRGTVRMVTLAPELPGALDAIRQLAAAGAVPAVGHTDATYPQAMAAFAAGARVATHLFNAMRPFGHRDPGVIGAALETPGVVCELVNDGIHLHDTAARLAFGLCGAGRVALVTDAIAAAGMGDGDYQLGSLTVTVSGGRAVLAGSSSIAGSSLTMDAAVRRAVHDLGVPLPAAVQAAATTPARLLGHGDRLGSIAPGRRADLVALDEDLRVAGVLRAGHWVVPPRQPATAGRLPLQA